MLILTSTKNLSHAICWHDSGLLYSWCFPLPPICMSHFRGSMMELPYIEGVYSDIESIKLWLILYVCVLSRFSCVQLFATPWTVAVRAPLSMVFSRQEYWSECPSPGDLPHPGMEPIFSNVTCIGRRVLYHFLYHLICPGFWKCTLLITCRKQCRMFPAAAAKPLQSCLTLCDPTDGSPPGSPVPGILQEKHWSGLPFPSPVCESEKWKWSRSVVSDS